MYAMNLVYSGNFLAQVEMSQQAYLRAVIGIHPEGFSWKLGPEESFQTPEAVLVYSSTPTSTSISMPRPAAVRAMSRSFSVSKSK